MEKQYKCIVKISNERFLKYNVNNLLLFTAFLDREFPMWRWYNVYSKRTKEQLANFTKNRRPFKKWV